MYEDEDFNSNEKEYDDNDFVHPYDSEYYNDMLDLDQQSDEFWEDIL